MRNVQHRVIAAPIADLGHLVDEIADRDRSVWPSRQWPRLTFDNGLRPGSDGGHGPIRYAVASHDPGRRLLMDFAPGSGLNGWHEIVLVPEPGPDGDGRTRLVHTISATTSGRMRVLWPLAVRWFHEALMEDLFDNAERRVTGTLTGQPARWSLWVRALRRMVG